MFARYFVELAISAGAVEDALSQDPSRWLSGLAEGANHRGDLLLAEMGFGETLRIKRTVVVELGPPVRSPSQSIFPIRWVPSGSAGLFPSLDADLEVAPIGPERTQLAMSARYVPPFGAVGRAVDRALLSRVAEATLKDFLDRVAHTIMSAANVSARGEGVRPALRRRPCELTSSGWGKRNVHRSG
jgi:hypothetical protein